MYATEEDAMNVWNVWMARPDPEWEPPLRAACCAGRVDEARALVAEHAVQVDHHCFLAAVVDAMGRHGHVSIGQWAVAEHGLDVKHFEGYTIFMGACETDRVPVCQWLTDHGFEPHDWRSWPDECSWDSKNGADSVFETAVARQHWAVARWLVQRRPEHPWPAKAMSELIAHSWSPARDTWMRSVVAGHGAK